MPQRAQVTSVEAIESFRAHLIVYLTKARAALDEVDSEKQRTRSWLQNDQRGYWEREYQRRHRILEEAQQELFSAKIAHLRSETAAQVMAVERARRLVREAEEKRDLVKRWSREFDNLVDPLARQLDQLQTFLTTDLTKATAHLNGVLQALEAYAKVGVEAGPDSATAPAAHPDAKLVPETPRQGSDDISDRSREGVVT
jgi:hypothetical protein